MMFFLRLNFISFLGGEGVLLGGLYSRYYTTFIEPMGW